MFYVSANTNICLCSNDLFIVSFSCCLFGVNCLSGSVIIWDIDISSSINLNAVICVSSCMRVLTDGNVDWLSLYTYSFRLARYIAGANTLCRCHKRRNCKINQ